MRSATAAIFAAVVRVAWMAAADPTSYAERAYPETDFGAELSNPSVLDADADELHELRCADCRAAARLATSDGRDYVGRFGLASTRAAKDPDRGRAQQQTAAAATAAVQVKRRDHRHRVVVPPSPRPQTTDPAALHDGSGRATAAAAAAAAAPVARYNVVATRTVAPKSPLPPPTTTPPPSSSVLLATTRLRKVSNAVFNIRWNEVMKKTTKTPVGH